MSDDIEILEVMSQLRVFITLTDEFHTVNHLIPDDQGGVYTIPPKTRVIDALNIMREKHFSQLPVQAGKTIVGVFSYRSFAERYREISKGKEKPDLDQMIVRDFLEKPHYVQVSDDLEEILDPINEHDYLLVGQKERLLGVITASDLARYAYRYASIWVLFSEIELTLRKLIQACVEENQLVEIARLTLNKIYPEEKLPKSIGEMTLSDYAQLIGHGQSYKYFEKVFGVGEWQRKRTYSKLNEIRELRNDAFHFKREIKTQDIDTLIGHRDWIKAIATDFEGQNKGEVK